MALFLYVVAKSLCVACPRMEKSRIDFKIEIDSYESIFLFVRKELVIFGN